MPNKILKVPVELTQDKEALQSLLRHHGVTERSQVKIFASKSAFRGLPAFGTDKERGLRTVEIKG